MRRLFAPTLLGAHLLALAAVGSAGWLGVWQYDAWQDRRAAESIDLTRLDPEPLADVMGPDDRFPGEKVGQPVRVSGTWVPDGTVYVSGREHDGADGYWVVTPLAVETADDPALPIVRGWTPSTRRGPGRPHRHHRLVAWLQVPRAPVSATTTLPTTYCRRCGRPTCSSTSTRTSTARTA